MSMPAKNEVVPTTAKTFRVGYVPTSCLGGLEAHIADALLYTGARQETNNMTIRVDGIKYVAEQLQIGPNLAKYDAQLFGLKGPKGAYYMLSQSVRGFWTMISMRGNRITKHHIVNVEAC